MPLDLTFRDEAGNMVRFGDYLGQKPLILTLNYYECPMLCPLVLDGLLRALRALPFTMGHEHRQRMPQVTMLSQPAPQQWAGR